MRKTLLYIVSGLPDEHPEARRRRRPTQSLALALDSLRMCATVYITRVKFI